MELQERLTEVLSEFARTIATDFSIQTILDHLVLRIVEVLPVTAAGVTLIAPGTVPRYVAASDSSALRFEKLQTELWEGPCLEAYTTGNAVNLPDLRQEIRFPAFAPRALEEGLVAVFAFPLRHGDTRLGALDLYQTTPGLLDKSATAAAQTLADVTAAYLLNAQARADLQEATEQSLELSLHDALTGLPNRTLLVQRLEHAVLRSRRSEKLVAILFADLDGFKGVNDTHGHHVGDELLVAVAERLTGLLRPGDTLARLSGDEFVIMCEDLEDVSQVEPLALRVDAAMAEPYVLTSAEVRVGASVGIAFAGRGDDVPERLLQDADTAMYQAKRAGGGRHGLIDLRERRRSEHRAQLSRDLGEAVSHDQLKLWYQPIVATADEHVAAAEALVRWVHPSLGVIAPAVAVPLAEQSGLINPIGRWVLERACLDRAAWPGSGEGGLEVAVNVSAHQLMSSDFVASVASVLAETATEPRLVTLEVTESVFIQDAKRAQVVLRDLKELGVLLALDDFGTGFSSLAYLKSFPVDIIKIDRSFIDDLGRDPASGVIVAAVIGLAHGLGMTVVAEGVESTLQYDVVATLGCDFYQGFHFARPMTAKALATTLADSRVAARWH